MIMLQFLLLIKIYWHMDIMVMMKFLILNTAMFQWMPVACRKACFVTTVNRNHEVKLDRTEDSMLRMCSFKLKERKRNAIQISENCRDWNQSVWLSSRYVNWDGLDRTKHKHDTNWVKITMMEVYGTRQG